MKDLRRRWRSGFSFSDLGYPLLFSRDMHMTGAGFV